MRQSLSVLLAILISASVAADEIALFKRVADPVDADVVSPLPMSVWEIDAPDRIAATLKHRYRWIRSEAQLAAAAPQITASLDKAAIKRAVLNALVAQTKVAQYALTRLPAAVLIDAQGQVQQRVYDFASVSGMLQKMGY